MIIDLTFFLKSYIINIDKNILKGKQVFKNYFLVCVHEHNGEFKLPLTPFEELNSKYSELLSKTRGSSGFIIFLPSS